MLAKNFFEQIKGFSDFSRIVDAENYFEAPNDWSVVLTDVKGSTKAIEQGRYREVNTLGAASIAVVIRSRTNSICIRR
jgi:hypothetical protein